MKKYAIMVITMALAATRPIIAAVVFTEDFEIPVVSGYSQGTAPSSWVKAAQGFGSGSHGLLRTNCFTTPPGNNQAYAFRYTNSGLTTGEGVIGVFKANSTYKVTFNVAIDGETAGTTYSVQLIAFSPGAARDDCRSTPPGSTVVASKSGNATTNDMSEGVNFSFTTGSSNLFLGQDIGIRRLGASTCALWDNVSVDIVSPPPTPTGLTAVPGSIEMSVRLDWFQPFDATGVATGYEVKRSSTNSGYVKIDSVSDTNYTDFAVRFLTNYYYVVSATNNMGSSLNSAPVFIKLSSPGTVILIR